MSAKRPCRRNGRKPARSPVCLEALDHLQSVWQELTPAERFRRSWRMRRLLPDPQRVHDEKIWPRP